MGQKLEVSFADNKVIFVNPKTAKAEGFDYIERINEQTAAAQLRKEVDGRPNVTRAALSVLIEVFQTVRLSAYKGQTPLNAPIPKEFKQAMREAESTHIRPLFLNMLPKAMSPEDKQKQADKYMSECWAGGVYAMVKAETVKYFCHMGKLPCVYNADGTPDTGKLLSTDAIKKLIQNAKEDLTKDEDETYKDKWVKKIMTLAAEFDARTGESKPDANETKAALNALRTMTASFEGIDREYAELRTRAGTTVANLTAGVLANAAKQEEKAELANV